MARNLFLLTRKPSKIRTFWLQKFGILLRKQYKIKDTISIAFVSLAEMKRLNKIYRGHNTPTDVLTFNYQTSRRKRQVYQHDGAYREDRSIGEIIICLPYLTKQAQEQGHSLMTEFKILTIHGSLHVLGYDHTNKTEAAIMKAHEDILFASLQKMLAN